MKFLLDQNVPDETYRVLAYRGYEVTRLREIIALGATDEAVFAYAQTKDLVIVSSQRQAFVEMAEKAKAKREWFNGLIVLTRRRSRQAEAGALMSLLQGTPVYELEGGIHYA